MVYRIIIAGSRDFNNYELLRKVLSKHLSKINRNQIEIISGGARGADTLGETFARRNDLKLTRFPADWDTYGKSAGFRRNAEMAKYAAEEQGMVFAFWDGQSKGTKHMIELGKNVGLSVYVINF